MARNKIPDPDRRIKKDRRSKPTSPFTSSSLFGARKHVRRAEDKNRHIYVDRYSTRAVLTVVVTVLLSLADAIFTIKLVGRGAEEINPVMDFFLQDGPVPFLIAKYLLTGTCLVLFLVHKNHPFLFGLIRVKSLMVGALVIYTLLIFYELNLLFTLGGVH